MCSYNLMILLEVFEGCYHACMCGRSGPGHARARRAMGELLANGLVAYVGDELMVTVDGREAIEWATNPREV